MKPYYQQETLEVASTLSSDLEKGLTTSEAKERLKKYGPNALAEKKRKSLAVRFLSQFKDFLVIILLIAAVISVAVEPDEWIESLIILIVVLINAILGVVQESKAENSLEALKKMSKPHAKVIRSGEVSTINSMDLVPGDIILLEAGDFIPADARITEAVNLQVDESALTGESLPVEKITQAIPNDSVPLGDRTNLLFSSTYVTYGRGRAIVYATGMETEIGKIAKALIDTKQDLTPLQIRLDQIGKVIAILCIVICVVVLGLELLAGSTFPEAFMLAVALAVASIPEALATVVTVVLAIGVEKMAKRNAIVKKLPAVETLGSASIVCSDKTGTLTQNKMTVVKVYTYENRLTDMNEELSSEERHVLAYFALCTDAKIVTEEGVEKRIGDPTELALIDVANKKKINYQIAKRVADLPFDSSRKMMSIIIDQEDGYLLITKGAPDIILEHSLPKYDKEQVLEMNNQMASQALRVLGIGVRKLSVLPEKLKSEELEQDLEFLGLVGMIDPARPEVKEAIQVALEAGIRTIMITGDHVVTAKAIAQELNILREGEKAISGTELHAISDEELFSHIEDYSVYARVAPEDKVRIVDAWQKRGHVVAMTGDGVNDSPALKKADIGCAMGITGTDVSKEAADVILVDDNYETIITAVGLGRNIYANIKKVVKYLLSSNIGEVFTIFIASVLSVIFPEYQFGVPLLAIHLLWVNLITDSLPAFALGTEEVEEGIMKEPPRPKKESFFAHKLGYTIIWQGIMIGTLSLLAYIIGHTQSPDTHLGQTMAFMTLSTTQLFHAFNMKSERSIFNKTLFHNKFLIGAFIVGFGFQLGIIYLPGISKIFKVESLNFDNLLLCVGLAICSIIIVEFVKLFKERIESKTKTAS